MVNELSSIKLFRTSEHPCSYISDQDATTVFLDPTTKISQKLNSALTDKGFRRSGSKSFVFWRARASTDDDSYVHPAAKMTSVGDD